LRQRLLMLWYVGLILLVVELALFALTGYMVACYNSMVWGKFNESIYTIQDVDPKIPYAGTINRYAREAGINGQLVVSVIQAESSFQARALSVAGAYGLMQIIPSTWQKVNKESKVCSGRHGGECNPECYYNPELNIGIGTIYLGELAKRYKGNMALAIAAYNAGPGAVEHYGGVPPYDETTAYTNRVISYWYELNNRSMPYFIFTAKQWDRIHIALYWSMILTLLALAWLVWRLQRSYRSWCWR
jgi:soluble lytic murein transglycosylase-like protein